MDLTQLFKASVKTVRLRNKSIPLPEKSRIQKIKPRDEFLLKAKDIRNQLTQLRNLLMENRAAYMRFGCHLKAFAHMTDEERDMIDQESEKIITIYKKFIEDLILEFQHPKGAFVREQFLKHKQNILEILKNYLKAVFRIYNDLRASRVQHELDTYKMLKLESNKSLIPEVEPRERVRAAFFKDFTKNSEDGDVNGADVELDVNHLRFPDDDNNLNENESKSVLKARKSLSEVAIDEDNTSRLALEDEHLASDDIQVFESENLHLLGNLKGLSEEVEQIAKQVNDIARLQELFSEKVSGCPSLVLICVSTSFIYLFQVNIQKTDIERIATTVIGATENVKDGNEQIKQSIQRNAGLRVFVLFFLIVMSFSLLFLDWYND